MWWTIGFLMLLAVFVVAGILIFLNWLDKVMQEEGDSG